MRELHDDRTVRGTSSTEPLAVVVRDLHVRYRVYADHRLTMRQLVVRGFRSREHVEVHAVRGINFQIRAGEVVGVVGPNGSGKSTLLRTVAGLQRATDGRVLVRSQPQLLGVASALQPKLSGYRNIYLGGLATGMRRHEVTEVIDDVIAFAELEDAIQRPIDTYSSGMRARLAFAIATLSTPDILLIDEALAVGDRHFRKKSLERVREIQAGAGTVMMVSHNLNEISATCQRTIWMQDGSIVADGPTAEVVERYAASESD